MIFRVVRGAGMLAAVAAAVFAVGAHAASVIELPQDAAIDPVSYIVADGDPAPVADEQRGAGLASVLLDGPVATVPEPVTWAMMLLGFALVGNLMRSRSRRARRRPRIRIV